MEIKNVAEVLASSGLGVPTLKALVPDENTYSVLLLQPQGNIVANNLGVGNKDSGLANKQFGGFLAEAKRTRADLAITPEYSMPWNTLVTAIKTGTVPEPGGLWALGCESIQFQELEEIQKGLVGHAQVLWEPLHPEPDKFVDPLAYVFFAPKAGSEDSSEIVVLIQFKTCPMGDPENFEVNGLQRGSTIYLFANVGPTVRLVSLICSDALDFLDNHAAGIYDRTLVLHIQLNADPRHHYFTDCRSKLLKYSGDATEVLCLNWAGEVNDWVEDNAHHWDNIAASAWYLKSTQYDITDTTLCENHWRGLYYTRLRTHNTHALFFNYDSAMFLLNSTKVVHIGVLAAQSRRLGPRLSKTHFWNDISEAWEEKTSVDDGFPSIVHESGKAEKNIAQIANENPLRAERILALCVGKIGPEEDWYSVCHLDSCVIERSEVVLRITFCQDTDLSASEFRIARLKLCGILWDILTNIGPLPEALADFKNGFQFNWDSDSPHQNASSHNGERATVIYMGEESNSKQVGDKYTRIADLLGRGPGNKDEKLALKQRLAIWYRQDGQIVLFEADQYLNIGKSDESSAVGIAREA